MRRFNITVNGNSYDVAVEEVGASASAPVATPAPAAKPAPTPHTAIYKNEKAVFHIPHKLPANTALSACHMLKAVPAASQKITAFSNPVGAATCKM